MRALDLTGVLRAGWAGGIAERVLGEPPGQWLTRFRFNAKRRVDFYEDLLSFVEAGMPPFQALEDMYEVTRKRKSMRWLTAVLAATLEDGREGKGLPVALGRWMPSEEAAMLTAGEQSGDLPGALERLKELVGRKVQMRSELMKELLPAGLMLAALLGVMYVVLITLIGFAEEMLSPADLARTTLAKHYIGFAQFIRGWMPLIGLVSVVSVVSIAMSMNRWRPSRPRQWLDEHLPPWSLYQRQQATFFLVAAAAMLRAGTPFKRVILNLQQSAAPWSRTHMARMLSTLGRGASPVAAMQTGMLPWDVADRLSIYARLPNIAVVMESTAKTSINILLKRTKTTGTIVRTLMMFLFASFILATLLTQNELSGALEAAARRSAI